MTSAWTSRFLSATKDVGMKKSDKNAGKRLRYTVAFSKPAKGSHIHIKKIAQPTWGEVRSTFFLSPL